MLKRITKIIGALALLLVASYFTFQLYSFFKPDFVVETAELATAYDDITVSGYIIREEQVLKYPYSGILSFEVKNGERVPSGGVIASVYKSENDLINQLAVKKLESKIENYNKSLENIDFGVGEITEIDKKIDDAIDKISSFASSGEGSLIYSPQDELEVLLNRKEAITGNKEAVEGIRAELKNELKSIKGKLKNSVASIKSPGPGYFVNTVDGLEDKLTPSMLDRLTVNDIEALPKLEFRSEDDNIIGKLITGYEWYFAAVVDKKGLSDFKEGMQINMKFPFALDVIVPATIKRISDSDGKSLVIIASNYIMDELNYVRSQSPQIIKKTYKGLKINRNALRVQDEKTGVFVRRGSVIQFVPIEVLCYKDKYVIAKWDETSKSVKLYDEVIVSGKNLYDGKLVN